MILKKSCNSSIKSSIELKFGLCFLEDLLCNNGLVAISPYDFQISLLVKSSSSQRICDEVVKTNGDSSFRFGSINQSLKKKTGKVTKPINLVGKNEIFTLILERWIAPKHIGHGSQEA